jgi:hypothetical protein
VQASLTPGAYYGIEAHPYFDSNGQYGFRQATYTAIQHIPILRNTWMLSLRSQVDTTALAGDQTIPFYLLPTLGGGSALRGFSSWRLRDRHSLLLSATSVSSPTAHLTLVNPIVDPVLQTSAMKQNPGTRSRTRAVVSGQKSGARRPQVRSKTSGTSMAMSHRTPSHCPAILRSSPRIAACVAGLL